MRVQGLAGLLAAGLLSGGVCAVAQPLYEIRDLTELAGAGVLDSGPAAINNHGEVVGAARLGTGMFAQAARWDGVGAAGGGAAIGFAAFGFLDGDNVSSLAAVSDVGMAVGNSELLIIEDAGPIIRFFFDDTAVVLEHGVLVPLSSRVTGGDTGLTLTFANDVTEGGVIVGWSMTEGGVRQAYRFDDGVVTRLGAIAGPSGESNAFGVNEAGVVAGVSQSAPPPVSNGHDHATAWVGGTIVDLHAAAGINGLYSEARDVNDLGWIVGRAQFDTTPARPAMWREGEVLDLGHLGFPDGLAHAVNNRGEVVGGGVLADGTNRAFLYRGGQMHDLDTLLVDRRGWEQVQTGLDINDRGEIVGLGRRFGELRAFVLEPVDRCACDWGFDGAVDVADLLGFLEQWYAGVADVDFDGVTNALDLLAFLVCWFDERG